MYELRPIYNSQKSFYGKAIVDNHKLYSYGVIVCEIIDNKPMIKTGVRISQTTLKHIKEFITQNGYRVIDKKQLIRDYMV